MSSSRDGRVRVGQPPPMECNTKVRDRAQEINTFLSFSHPAYLGGVSKDSLANLCLQMWRDPNYIRVSPNLPLAKTVPSPQKVTP